MDVTASSHKLTSHSRRAVSTGPKNVSGELPFSIFSGMDAARASLCRSAEGDDERRDAGERAGREVAGPDQCRAIFSAAGRADRARRRPDKAGRVGRAGQSERDCGVGADVPLSMSTEESVSVGRARKRRADVF